MFIAKPPTINPGGAFTIISSKKLTKLDLPIDDTDAANKFYVDDFVSGVASYTRTVVNTNTYTFTNTDDIIAVTYTPTGQVILTIPKITTRKQYTIVDEGGNSGINNIIINTDVLDTIIGQTSYTIKSNYNSITIYNDENTKWFIR